jgi:hypothetical protein
MYRLAAVMEAVPVAYTCTGAKLAIVPTPEGWGWAYTTNRERTLVWLPGGVVVTRGMETSRNFAEDVRNAFGQEVEIPELAWLDRALERAVKLERGTFDDPQESVLAREVPVRRISKAFNGAFLKALAEDPAKYLS